jgi:glutathione S-transferase
VYESMIIAEYFDEKYPNRGIKIYPEDVHKKATARLLISRFGDKVTKHLYELLSNPNPEDQERLRENVRNALVDFNKDVNNFAPREDFNGPYLLGDFSALDIAVFPFIDRFTATLKYYREYDLLSDAPEYDRIYSAFNACKSRPAFQGLLLLLLLCSYYYCYYHYVISQYNFEK